MTERADVIARAPGPVAMGDEVAARSADRAQGGEPRGSDGAARDAVLDGLARAAGRITGAPTCVLSLAGAETTHTVAGCGVVGAADADRLRRLDPLCRQVVASGRAMIVPDLAADAWPDGDDARLDPHAGAYAGVPLVSTDGRTLGALSVVDTRSRAWSEADVAALHDLAAAAAARLELVQLHAEGGARTASGAHRAAPDHGAAGEPPAGRGAEPHDRRLAGHEGGALGAAALEWTRLLDELARSETLARDRFAELDQTYRYAPVGLFTFDRAYRFTRINERMAAINGLPAEAHAGRSMWEVVPALADHLVEVFRPVLEHGEPALEVELRGETPAQPGVPRDWLASYFPLRSGNGAIVGIIGAVLEVTERKQAERERERLLALERSLRARSESAQRLTAALARALTPAEVIAVAVAEGVATVGSSGGAAALLVGAPDDATAVFRFVAGPGLTPVMADAWHEVPNAGDGPMPRAVRTGAPVYSRTRAEYVARDAALVAVADTLGIEAEATLPLVVGRGAVRRTLGALSFTFDQPQAFDADADVHLRMVADQCAQALERARLFEAEQAARAAAEVERQRLALILDRLPVGVVVVDAAGGVVHRNPACDATLGRSLEPVAGLDDDAENGGGLHADGRPSAPADYPVARALRHGEEVHQELTRYRHADGRLLHVSISASPVRDADGGIVYAVATIEDVTTREADRQRLTSQAAQLAAAAAHPGLVLGTVDRDLRYTSLFNAHPDFDPAVVVGKRDDELGGLDADAAARLVAVKARVLATGAPARELIRAPLSDGEAAYEVLAHPIRDPAGEVIGAATVSLDVTERERATAALAASEANLRHLFEQAPVPIAVLRGPEHVGEVQNAAYRALVGGRSLLGRSVREVLPELEGQGYFDLLDRVYATGEPYVGVAMPVRLHRDGVLVDGYHDFLYHPLRDDKGGVTGVLVVATDVTEQIRAREAVERARATADAERRQLALILDQLPVGVFVADAQGVAVHHNPTLERLLRHPAGERESIADCARYGAVHDDGRPYVPDDYPAAQALRTGVAVEQATMRYRRGDGTDTILAVSAAPVRDATGAIRYAVTTFEDVAEREQMAEALRASEERYAYAARATNNAIWDWNLVSDVVAWGGSGPVMFGHALADIEPTGAWWMAAIHPDDRDAVAASVQAVLDDPAADTEWAGAYRFRRADGSWAEVRDRGFVLRDANGRAVRMVGAMEDVTAQRLLEDRLRQAQKMEAVGQLAGGIAHDFNNLLTVICGNLEFVLEDLPSDHGARPDLGEIATAADRARSLVRQLLAFSRKQEAHPRAVRVGEVVAGAEKLLRRVIGEEIVLDVATDDEDALVHADPGQLEQVLMNLAVNARDAMLMPVHGQPGRGGTLTIECHPVALGAGELAELELPPAERHLRLVVRDTGHGMDAATHARAFEPFFTTKPVGAGTGLGLATVFGVVRQAGGAVRIATAVGRGTTVTVTLPVIAAEREAHPVVERGRTGSPRAMTILLVEDEAPVRAMTRRLLERAGHAVLEARHGADALLLWRTHARIIDAVVTDIRMPELGGRELAAHLHADRPGLPVVFMSGYAEHAAVGGLQPHERFVAKPYRTEVLLRALAEVGAAR